MDTPTVPLMGAMDIASAEAYVQFLKDLKDKVLKQGTDYGAATGESSKPSLLKPGAEKVAKILGYRAQFVAIDHRLECDTLFVNFGYKCILIDKDGQAVMEGEGYCNSHEPKYRWKWADAPQPDKDTQAQMKLMGTGRNKNFGSRQQPRWAWQERRKADDTLSHANTMSKIAQKRAFVAAVLFASGLSEFFTQDIEDMPRTDDDQPAEHTPEPELKRVVRTEKPPPPRDPANEPDGRELAIIELIMKQVRRMDATRILADASVIVADGKTKGLTENGINELKRCVNETVKEKRDEQRANAQRR